METNSTQQIIEPVAPVTENTQQPKPNTSKVVIFVLIIIVIALLILVAYLFRNTSFVLLPSEKEQQEQAALTEPPITPTAPITPPISAYSDWETYTDPTLGFTFKYPKSVLLNSEVKNAKQLVLSVVVDKISQIPEDLPLGMGRGDVLLEKTRISKGEGENIIKFGNTNAEVTTISSQYEVCSVLFIKKISFFSGDYHITITLHAPKDQIVSEMPEYFTLDNNNCSGQIWNQDKLPDFAIAVKNNQSVGMAKQWQDALTGIIDTMNLVSPTTAQAPKTGTVYKNSEYGFELSYPTGFKVLTDSDNLSGYPHGVALVYSGGQAYNVVIEVWDTESAYKSNYSTRLADVTVLQNGGKFITIFNNTLESQNKQIINSVKISE